MGTRADYYVKNGGELEWLGSIAWDGYETDTTVLAAMKEDVFRESVAKFFSDRDDVTLPSDGWPWPWNTSETTDYQYTFDIDQKTVVVTQWGRVVLQEESDDAEAITEPAPWEWPDMSATKNVRFDHGSGLIILETRHE